MEKLQHGSEKPQLVSVRGMDKTQIAFRLADKNKDGFIDRPEFHQIAKNLPKDKIDKVFDSCDKNHDY